MVRFRFKDKITSDVEFVAYGSTLNELFENAAYALFNVICDVKKVKHENVKHVKLKDSSVEGLLLKWLETLIAYVDIHEMFFSKFDVKITDKFVLDAKVYGEPAVQSKAGTLVKGISYHDFKIEKQGKQYKATITCDI